VPQCDPDATSLYAMLMAHAEKHSERVWTLDSLLRGTAWGQPRCFVAEVIEPAAAVHPHGYRVLLATSTWVGKEQVAVILRAYAREEPPRLKRDTFVSVSGTLARMNRAENGELWLTLESSTFSDQWSKALEPAQVGPSTAQR
jgi:hypothetical protein